MPRYIKYPDLNPCPHPGQWIVYGRRRLRQCYECRNEQARREYAETNKGRRKPSKVSGFYPCPHKDNWPSRSRRQCPECKRSEAIARYHLGKPDAKPKPPPKHPDLYPCPHVEYWEGRRQCRECKSEQGRRDYRAKADEINARRRKNHAANRKTCPYCLGPMAPSSRMCIDWQRVLGRTPSY